MDVHTKENTMKRGRVIISYTNTRILSVPTEFFPENIGEKTTLFAYVINNGVIREDHTTNPKKNH